MIAVQGCRLGRGNPHWAARQTPSPEDAACVRALLGAGAIAVGTTWLDEFAFGLSGENPWSGAAPNPQAPGRISGGSSSGSAAAVALGTADFALGTDTAGSIRVPASWCGLWGLRPSHGAVSSQGVAPLAPSLDTVAPLAGDGATLRRVSAVLRAAAPGEGSAAAAGASPAQPCAPRHLLWIPELWNLAEPPVHSALLAEAQRLASRLALPLEPLPLAELSLESPEDLLAILQPIQWAEAENSLAEIPADLPLGPTLTRNRELVASRDRTLLAPALERRHHLRQRLDALLGCGDGAGPGAGTGLLVLPITPCPAPARGSLRRDRSVDRVLQRLLILGALAGLGGLPQLSRPGATVEGLPVGLGLIAGRGRDADLLTLGSVEL